MASPAHQAHAEGRSGDATAVASSSRVGRVAMGPPHMQAAASEEDDHTPHAHEEAAWRAALVTGSALEVEVSGPQNARGKEGRAPPMTAGRKGGAPTPGERATGATGAPLPTCVGHGDMGWGPRGGAGGGSEGGKGWPKMGST